MSPGWIALLAAMMVATSALGAITGGNSLINVPVLITLGMAPREAVATNMFQVTFMTISATVKFARGGHIRKDLLLPLSLVTAATSALGALLAVKLPEAVVKAVVGVSMAALVLFMLLHRSSGAPRPVSDRRRWMGYGGATLLGVYGGFFSGGYTTLMTVLCTALLGLSLLQSVAITKPINLVSCLAACAVFFAGGLIDLRVGLPLAAANLLGGWLGAHVAIKQGDRFVRLLFLATVGVLAAKLLVWDLFIRDAFLA